MIRVVANLSTSLRRLFAGTWGFERNRDFASITMTRIAPDWLDICALA